VIDNAQLARGFFAAIERGDTEAVAACYAPDATIWHNYDDVSQTRAENVTVLAGFVAATRERRYTEIELKTWGGGFAQQHVLVAVARGGAVLRLPAALFCDVADGRIVRLREYFDPAPVAAWRESPGFA
jgi:ketosteroid isomerase-like protein